MGVFFDTIFFWANNNQGVIAIAIFILGIIGSLLFKSRTTKKFVQKGGKNSKNYQAENLTINHNE